MESDTYVYEFVPFVPRLKAGVFGTQNAAAIGQQLKSIVDHYQARGWEYVQLEQVEVTHAAGCLASLFGRQNDSVAYDIIVFRVPREAAEAPRSERPSESTSTAVVAEDPEEHWEPEIEDPDALERATQEAMRQ